MLYDSDKPVTATLAQLPAPPAAPAQRSRTPERTLPWMRGKASGTQSKTIGTPKGSGKDKGKGKGKGQQGKKGKK